MQTLLAEILSNLGTALFHSVWQGAVAFLAVVCARALTHEKDSAIRYIAQVFILFATFGAFLATFATYQFSSASGVAPQLIELSAITTTGITTDSGSGASALALDQAFARYAPWFGLFWCLGFVVLSLRYAADYRFTQKLRRHGLTAVPKEWQSRFSALAKLSGLSRDTGFFVSNRVSGPVTLGTFKPIILVPFGFFARIPSDQVEAILLHEIAHIRRNDYFINLLQTAIKTVFFYHPAITYICRKIDQDREYACDDFAIGRTNNPLALAKGLAAVRLSTPSAAFALAANGKDTPLLARLKRISGHRVNHKGHGPFASTLAALVLMAAVVASGALTDIAEASPDRALLHGEKMTYHFEIVEQNGQHVMAKIAGDGTRWVRIDDDWHDLDRSEDAKRFVQALAGGPDGNAMTPPEPPVPPRPPNLSRFSPDGSGLAMEEFERTMEQFEINMEYFEAQMELYADQLEAFHDDRRYSARVTVDTRTAEQRFERQMEQQEQQLERMEDERERQMERIEDAMEREMERMEDARERKMERLEDARERHAENKHRHDNHSHSKLDKFEAKFTKQLKKDGLIKPNASTIKFEISEDNMTVNGTTIPERLENNYCEMIAEAGIKKTRQTKITITNHGESFSIHSQN
jgi:beta-lactamase regulating signal transducer with metallopeptidase domain